MKKNLFEMGADFGDDWTSDNKDKSGKKISMETKEPSKHQLHFAKEKRRGKSVTIVKPFYLTESDLQTLAKTLKKKLGTGGTAKENSLEFQGDIADSLRTHLEALGYRFKK
ncbi:translation initiation factor [Sulfurovum sp.]|uniref:translation initiation factor n=1 Tax=Sulfurovum sp. TaxID=1969726 RepID=UPI0025D3406D|nr:translation initiation factor [Sulfurovum sp.]